jgi:hypothetical protein
MNYEYEISVAIPNTLVESFEEETEEIGNIVKAVRQSRRCRNT